MTFLVSGDDYLNINQTLALYTADPQFCDEFSPNQCTGGSDVSSGYANATVTAGGCSGYGYGNPQVVPNVTFSPSFQGIPQGGSQNVAANFVDQNGNPVSSSPTPIKVTLTTTTGTGAAIFTSGGTIAPGGASTQITSPTTLTIQGTTASSAAGNIKLDATIPAESGTPSIARPFVTFSVVSVSLSLQTNGAVAVRNPDFPYPNLGVQILDGEPPGYTACSGALQITGKITPNDYSGPIFLRKNVTYDQCEDPGTTLLASASGQDDTSDPSLEATSSGNIYELDSPGNELGSNVNVGSTVRFRANFDSYAVLGTNTSTTRVSTADMNFYVRVSCTKSSLISVVLDSTYSGDNQIGLGTTKLSDNLQ